MKLLSFVCLDYTGIVAYVCISQIVHVIFNCNIYGYVGLISKKKEKFVHVAGNYAHVEVLNSIPHGHKTRVQL